MTRATSFETLCSLQDGRYSFPLTAKELGLEMLTDLCYSPELRNGGAQVQARAVWPQHTIEVLRCVLRRCTHGEGWPRGLLWVQEISIWNQRAWDG